jgi:integrase/recombinase XerC
MTVHNEIIEPQLSRWTVHLAAKGRSSNTVDCYRRDVRDVFAALIHIRSTTPLLADLSSVGQKEIDELTSYWSSAGASDTTIVRRFSALKSFARYLSTAHQINCATILSAQYPRALRKFRPAIEGDASAALTVDDESSDWIAQRNKAAVLLLACSGLTTAEIVGLNQQDFVPERRLINVTRSRLRARVVAISNEAASAIKSYQEAFPFPATATDPLFVTNWQTRLSARSLQVAFRRRRRLVGLSETAVPTALRHSLGYNLAWSGATPEVVARALGLSVTSVSRYFRPP